MPRSSGRKRMPHGMGSIRKRTTKRKDGSVHEFWEGRVAHGYHPDTGKQKVITVSGNTQREVLDRWRMAGRLAQGISGLEEASDGGWVSQGH